MREEDDAIANELADLLSESIRGNDELRLFIKGDLRERLANARPTPDDDTAEEVLEWMKADNPTAPEARRSRARGLKLAASIVTLAWLVGFACEVPLLLLLANNTTNLSRPKLREADARLKNLRSDPPGDYLLPWAEVNANHWRYDPNDPVLYMAWILSGEDERVAAGRYRELPEGYDQVWRRIDPDNAMWLLIEAETLMEKGGRHPFSHLISITDLEMYRKAAACIEEASHLPRADTYWPERAKRIEQSFRKTGSMTDMGLISIAASREFVFDRIQPTAEMEMLWMRELRAKGEFEDARKFLAACQRCLLLRYSQHDMPGYPIKLQADLFRKAIPKEDWPQEWHNLGEMSRAMALQASFPNEPKQRLISFVWSDSVAIRAVAMVFMRWLILGLSATSLLVAGCAAFRVMLNPQTALARSADSLAVVLERKGFRRVLCAGFLLPSLVILVCIGLVSVDPLEMERLLLPFAMILVGLPLVISGIEFARKDQGVRLGFTGLGRATPWVSPGNAILVMVFVLAPLILIFFPSREPGLQLLHTAGFLIAISVVVTAFSLCRGLFSVDGRLRQRLLARRLIPAALAHAALLLLLLPVLHLAEWKTLINRTSMRQGLPEHEAFTPDQQQSLERLRKEWGVTPGK